MPFTFANNSIVTHRGLNSLFIIKSVSFSAIKPKLFCAQLQLCAILRIPFVLLRTVVLTQVRRYLFMHYTPETLLNHVFEDLRKPKAPNSVVLKHLMINVCWGEGEDTTPRSMPSPISLHQQRQNDRQLPPFVQHVARRRPTTRSRRRPTTRTPRPASSSNTKAHVEFGPL